VFDFMSTNVLLTLHLFGREPAGILHFSSDYDAPSGPVERFSGYRFCASVIQ
jgi:hypothetical protein